ncbi:MAG: DNA-directed DNA polymerase II small subunit [Candidatus Poseidoniaceae archaeon]|jgi:DNA polymerase II small subunit|nr:DNA-directed DNA polymerase II small subunit [Candidatus Poseidoniaceae archaeon]
MVDERWQAIFEHCLENGILIKRDIKEKLLQMDDPMSVVKTAEPGFLSLDDVTLPVKRDNPLVDKPQDLARVVAPLVESEIVPVLRIHGLHDYDIEDFPMLAKDASSDIEVHWEITGNSVTEGKMQDIRSCFKDRLKRIKQMILKSGLPSSVSDIARLQAERRRYTGFENVACAVGLVNDPRTTKNGHLIFEIEDNTGSMTCLIRKDSEDPNPVVESGIMPDNVIGVSGSFARDGDLFYVDDLHWPHTPIRQRTHAEQGVSVAFLSDIHVGSKTFLEAQWHKMAQWMREDPLGHTIKYLILSGDVVDGVGIYPNQDKELAIKDLYKQYSHFAGLLELLPDWVECILLPGNHDAVRPAEPQPALEPELQQEYNTTKFVGNPCEFSLHGVRLLSYHGKSIDDFVSGMRTISYGKPAKAMKQMLKQRHLAPQWGGKTPLSPEPMDNLVISTVPDIFVTGHVHGHACINHRGTTLICSSTWQDQTSYQRMLGFQPQPCILTIVNLGTHKTASIPFA